MKVIEISKIAEMNCKDVIARLNELGYTEITHHLQDVSDKAVEEMGITIPKSESVVDDGQIHFWSSKAEKHRVVIQEGERVTTVRFSDFRLLLDKKGSTAKGLLKNKPRDVYVVLHQPCDTEDKCDAFRGYLYRVISPDGEVTPSGIAKVKGLLTKKELASKSLICSGQQYIDRLVGMIVRTRSIEGMKFK